MAKKKKEDEDEMLEMQGLTKAVSTGASKCHYYFTHSYFRGKWGRWITSNTRT